MQLFLIHLLYDNFLELLKQNVGLHFLVLFLTVFFIFYMYI